MTYIEFSIHLIELLKTLEKNQLGYIESCIDDEIESLADLKTEILKAERYLKFLNNFRSIDRITNVNNYKETMIVH